MKTWLRKLFRKSQSPAEPSDYERTLLTNPDQTIPISGANDAAIKAAEIPAEWQVGDLIREIYEIKEIHGGGGMGLVYRAYRRDWGKEMAVKSPRAEYFQTEAQKENFVRECLTWIGLGLHSHIVCCYYVRILGGIPRVFAEYVEGGSLKEWIESGKLYEGGREEALKRLLDVAIQSAWGLRYAHEQGLIHQDVKPANMMLTAEGVVKVTDFGLAKARAAAGDASILTDGASLLASIGGMTPAYCSPEQAAIAAQSKNGTPPDDLPKLTRRTDLWSWAVTVLEMFTGEPPCRHGQTAGEVFEEYARVKEADPIRPKMSPSLVNLIRHCFRGDPAERPGDFDEVIEKLLTIYREAVGIEYPRETPKPVEAQADTLNNQAIAMLELGKNEEAESKFAAALESDPHHPEATYNRGLLQWRLIQITDQQLVTRLEEAAKSDADSNRCAFLLGLTHIERGDAEAAAKALEALSGPKRQRMEELLRSGLDGGGCQRTFEGHADFVTSVAVSPDGCWVLSGSEDKTVRLWDLTTGRCLRTFEGHTEDVMVVAFSPDGRLAVSGSKDKTLRLWELATGGCLRTFEGHTGGVPSVAFSPDGRWVLSGSWDKTLRLWEVRKGRCVRTFDGHAKEVVSVAISPDGRWALSGGPDRKLRFWELATGRCLRIFEEQHTMEISSVAISPDGCWALSGAWDRTLRLWELATGRCLRTFVGHTLLNIGSVAFSPNGRWALSSAGREKTLRLWEVATGRCLRTFEVPEKFVAQVAFSPDGRWVLAGTGGRPTVGLWELATGNAQDLVEVEPAKVQELSKRSLQMRENIQTAVTALQGGDVAGSLVALRMARRIPGYERHPDVSKQWASMRRHCKAIGLLGGWSLRTFNGFEGCGDSVAFSSDGRWALFGNWKTLGLWGSWDKTLRLWELADGRCQRTFKKGDTKSITSVAISPDGRWALSGSDDTMRIWEVETGCCLHMCEGHTKKITSVAISPDGCSALSGSEDTTMRLWDIATGRYLYLSKFEGHTKTITSLAISPDGRLALSGSHDKTLRLWELATGHCLRVFTGHTQEISSVTISPDGHFALSGSYDRGPRLWELATGRCLRIMEGHTGAVTSVAISPDGCWALSGSWDHTMRLWELATGRCHRTFEGHAGWVTSVAFSPDGCWALSVGEDGTLRIWQLDWDYEAPPAADFDEQARPHLEHFLTLRYPRGVGGFTQAGRPPMCGEEDFQKLFANLQNRGFGWLRPDGVRRELEKMTAHWEGPPPLPGERASQNR